MKEEEKKDKYLDLAWELKKKLWNMKVTIIPILIGDLGTVTKWSVQGLKDLEITGRVENIQTNHYWDRPEYWEESWRLVVNSTSVEDYLLMLTWKTLKEQKKKKN